MLESLLLRLGSAVSLGSGEVGKGPMARTGKDGEGERLEREVVGC